MEKYGSKDETTAVHIVPFALSPKVVAHAYGSEYDDDDVWNVRNCLPMAKQLEAGMDKGFFRPNSRARDRAKTKSRV